MILYKYNYLIAYNIKAKDGATGLGEASVSTRKKLNTYGAIKDVGETIKKDNDFQGVAIVNVIRLKGNFFNR